MDKLGIKYERIVFGKYKDMMSPFRNLTPEEQQLIMKKLSYLYDYFVKEVAKNRHLNYSYAKKLATGEIFFGYEAINNGLIDKIGDLEDCKEIMAERLNTTIDNITFTTVKGYEEQEFNLFGLSLGYGLGLALKNDFEKLLKLS
jgi:protease-4